LQLLFRIIPTITIRKLKCIVDKDNKYIQRKFPRIQKILVHFQVGQVWDQLIFMDLAIISIISRLSCAYLKHVTNQTVRSWDNQKFNSLRSMSECMYIKWIGKVWVGWLKEPQSKLKPKRCIFYDAVSYININII